MESQSTQSQCNYGSLLYMSRQWPMSPRWSDPPRRTLITRLHGTIWSLYRDLYVPMAAHTKDVIY